MIECSFLDSREKLKSKLGEFANGDWRIGVGGEVRTNFVMKKVRSVVSVIGHSGG